MRLLIVNFHYFREEKYASGIYPINQQSLMNQINELKRYYTFISQEELVGIFNTKQYPDKNYCLITFDDGLKEQMDAFRWLKQNNIPAIFYVPVKPFVEGTVLEVHKLHLVRAQVNDEDLLLQLKNIQGYVYTTEDAAAAKEQYKYDNNIARELKYQLNFKLSEDNKTTFINTAFGVLYPDEKAFSKTFYMSTEDIKQLAEAGMLGSHGYAHVPLSQYVKAKDDIITSINWLENVTGKSILSFSYPYGSKAAVNHSLIEHFNHTNVAFALTMWRGLNEVSNDTNSHLLLRVDTNDAPGGKNNSTEYIL